MRYQIDVNEPHKHIVKIKLSFTSQWENPILEMPVWTPGSYKVRDYSKNVFQFHATSLGEIVEYRKISKNQWQLALEKGVEAEITYQVYAHNLTVRTAFLDSDYGLLSPASLFFYIVDQNRQHNKNSPVRVTVIKPDNWDVFTSLNKIDNEFIAEDFDELIDSPYGLARSEVIESLEYNFETQEGTEIPCKIAIIGHKGNQDIQKFKNQMVKLQEKSIEMFGSLPYDRYLWVLYVVGSGGGGLEHKYSNFSIINRWYFEKDDMNYAKLMSLEAHEHFHAYNIKRIRPTQLGPFEYDREVYTTLLWVAEGITSFYDNIFLPRTGIIGEETYWKVIAKDYTSLQKIEGRFQTTLSESSFDAWIKLYQRHNGSDNLFVSYYLKGGIVSLMLDLEIRKQTDWEHSLDDFFKKMYNAYLESNKTYDENNFRKLVEETTNTDLEVFWNKYIDGIVKLPLNEYLNLIGMKLYSKKNEEPYVGIELSGSSTKIKSVRAKSPAYEAGLSPNDKLIAINNYEVSSSTMNTLVKNSQSGDKWKVHYVRDGILKEVTLTLAESIPKEYVIKPIEEPTDQQIERKLRFLHLE